MNLAPQDTLKIEFYKEMKDGMQRCEKKMPFKRLDGGDVVSACARISEFGKHMVSELERRFPNHKVYTHFQIFRPMTDTAETKLVAAAKALLPFLGPKPVGETELLRQLRCFAALKRELRTAHHLTEVSDDCARSFALRCLERIASEFGCLHVDDVADGAEVGKPMFAVARLLALYWISPVNSTECERIFSMGSTLGKKLTAEAARDDELFKRYLTVLHHGPPMDVAELPDGLFARVAAELLKDERRTARSTHSSIVKGKAFAVRFRRARKDKGIRGKRKPYVLKKRLAERTVIEM